MKYTLKNTYISKSFWCIGNSLKYCYNCNYCRLLVGSPEENYSTLPTQISKYFKNIPVAINLFYGDPLLQIDKTIELLYALEKEKHKGPVVIITKGDFSKFPDIYFDLDIHVAFSTFGINSLQDGGNWERFLNNINQISKREFKYKYSIEFRPICYGINDDFETLKRVFKVAKEYNLCIGYSGLQGKKEIVKIWEEEKLPFAPYPGYSFGHLKPLSKEVQENLVILSKFYNVSIFHKTSCLISYVHGLDRDYNCHYYRPDEVDCKNCPMNDFCRGKKYTTPDIQTKIPFKYIIEYKEKHECSLKQMNLCNYPTKECSNIQGYIIKIEEELTAADYRMIKWLTGYAVDCKFTQSEELSIKWLNK